MLNSSKKVEALLTRDAGLERVISFDNHDRLKRWLDKVAEITD